MAYSDFTIDQLSTDFGVDFEGGYLFPAVESIAPSAWLSETLALAGQLGFGTDKSRFERLVSPVLLDIAQRNQYKVAVISGEILDVAPEYGLTGICDVVLSFTKVQDFIKAPVCCITGARTQEHDNSLVECAAQLIGAALLNERDKKHIPILYGCVTTGVEWRFLKFENQVFTLDEARYFINKPTQLLGVLQYIIDQTRPALA